MNYYELGFKRVGTLPRHPRSLRVRTIGNAIPSCLILVGSWINTQPRYPSRRGRDTQQTRAHSQLSSFPSHLLPT